MDRPKNSFAKHEQVIHFGHERRVLPRAASNSNYIDAPGDRNASNDVIDGSSYFASGWLFNDSANDETYCFNGLFP